ncbi:MAG: PKD domain-containing protein, partial [bacterium]|nr:PKD domain-containing protein [bacterium]
MSIRSLLLVLCVCLVATAATADTVTRGPYLQLGTPDGVVIRWRTDVATSSEVRYGTTQGNLSATEFDAAADTEHEIELTGLSPGTRYWYSVGAMGGPVLAGDDADHFFDTAPPVGATPPVRVWVLGDSGANVNNAGAVRDAYVGYTGARHTDLWLMLGDNAYTTGLDEEFQIKLFDVFPEMLRRSVLWPTIGNHDGIAANSGQQTGPYFDIFNLPDNAQAGGMVSGTESYYSFDYANIHFVVLDSHGSDRLIGGPMMDWLESDLAVTAQQWIIAYWHHPPYSKGGHDSDDVPLEQQLVDMRDNAVRVLEDHGVDLVMTGHSHSYERSIMIDGHYGFSDDFGPQHVVDPGDGREVGDGAYVKPAAGPHQGAVYQVAGSSSQLSGGLLNHPVMYVSHNVLGSVVLDVEGYRLDAVFLDSVGAELDSFTILKDPDLVVDFSATPESDPVPLSVTFSDQSLVEATQWEWDFDGDGTTDSTEEIPTHVYEQPGQYSVRLRITGPKGTFERTKVDFIDAFLAPPLADFVTDVFTGIAPLSVSFTDRSGNTPDQWEWDFDDDGTPDSTEQNPVHVYDTPGVYSVRLTVMNAEGTSSEIRSDLITVLPRAPDEVTGFTVDVDRQTMSWDPNPAACGYDLVRVDLAALRASGGDYRVSQLGCVNEDIVSTLTSDPTLPGPGQIVAYLARITDCGGLAGTFDTSGLGMIETRDPELQGPGSACGCLPGDDLDVDLFCNTLDNCPTTYNQGQSDYDLDGLGDVCDCDPTDWRCSSDCTDADADQFCVTTDCDDTNAAVNPTTTWFLDQDGDGFGLLSQNLVQCAAPPGYSLGRGDCDDISATAVDTYPGAAPNDSPTLCMRDRDHDGWGDDDPQAGVTSGTDCDDLDPVATPETQWFPDNDGDGFGDLVGEIAQCESPPGHTMDSTDCDDTSPTAGATYPGAAPNDDSIACMKDVDDDDWGDDQPPAGVVPGSDCNDANATANPTFTWYLDGDGDGFGDLGAPLVQCSQPVGHVSEPSDCDDASATTFPGAAPNDGVACMSDVDGDGWGDAAPAPGVAAGTDCDDSAADTFPGAAPNDSGVACMRDADGDDWGDDTPQAGATPGSDCDDTEANTSPDTQWYADTDGDGFGDFTEPVSQCLQPAEHVADATDCDDTSPTATDTYPGAAPNDSSLACMKDTDGDDWGDSSPLPGVFAGTDCDDDDDSATPDRVWYADTDGDGFGDTDVPSVQCTEPAGFVLDGTDCDDTSPSAADTHPGAAPNDSAGGCLKDVDGDDWGDVATIAGVTPGTDCDDSFALTFPGAAPNDAPAACYLDADGDDWGDENPPAGVTAGTDCDDSDAQLHPDTPWYADTDGDGFGDPGALTTQCLQPAGHLADATDCDDSSPAAASTFPGAAPNDSADGCLKDVDGDDWGDADPLPGVTPGSDCDDDDAFFNPTTTWYRDKDGDGFGDLAVSLAACTQPSGYLLDSTDCDDISVTSPATFPGAAPSDGAGCMRDSDGDDWGDDSPPAGVEAGTDCDDFDALLHPATTWYVDADGDGFGSSASTLVQCTEPAGFVPSSTDCDDVSPTASATFPGAAPNDSADACMKDLDGDDWGDASPQPGIVPGTDCDDADFGFNPGTTWYADTDGDGFGDPNVNVDQCSAPAGHVLDSTDCDDTSGTAADTHPGAAPNDSLVACMRDVDGDGWGDSSAVGAITPGTDCDDDSATASATHPSAAPNDGAGCMKDIDGDDWGDDDPPPGVGSGTDCDDADVQRNPDTVWYADTDADGYGDRFVTLAQCVQPAGYVAQSTDCDDTSPAAAFTFPGAAPNDDGFVCMKDVDGDDWGDEAPNAGVFPGSDCNDADPGLRPDTTWFADTDGDGFGDPALTVVQCDAPLAFVLVDTDCDDTSAAAAATFPGAAPNDSAVACMKDVDGDDWADASPSTPASPGTDCDDDSPTAADTYPGAAPNDSAIDCMRDVDGDDWGDETPPQDVSAGTDCDDDDEGIQPDTIWYADLDGDTFGDRFVTLVQCTQPTDHVLDSTDCDDVSATAAATFPGAAPNDNPVVCMKDADGDDYADQSPPAGIAVGTDCDDSDAVIHPQTIWHRDLDADGFGHPNVTLVQCVQPAGHVLNSMDCDDSSGTAAFTFPGAAPNDSAEICMRDVDGDDWGDDSPPGNIASGSDCDDGDPLVHPTTTWYADIDGDGFGDPGVSVVQCDAPASYRLDNTDCDDTSPTAAATYPGSAPNDNIACMRDVDGDNWGDANPPAGVSPGTDCDDNNEVVHPETMWYLDLDTDGFGDPGVSVTQCAQPDFHLLNNTDCDDSGPTAAFTFPGAALNDGAGCMKDVDDDDWGDDTPPPGVMAGTDCNDVDAVLTPVTVWHADTDTDGFGDPGVTQVQCPQPAGYLLDNTDCDDTSGTAAATYPGAAPNDGAGCMKDVDSDDWGDDNPPAGVSSGTDCDDTDSVLNPTTIWYADTDLDGFGDPGVSQVQCVQPAGHLLDSTDCDDTSGTAAATFPGAAPNDGGGCFKDVDGDDWGDDNPPAGVSSGTDCDDTDSVLNPTTIWYADTDLDGFGDPGVSQVQCAQPAGHLLDNTDCDDTSGTAASTFPGAASNDGAGCFKDVDGDDWGDDNPPAGVPGGTDCNDADAVLNPTTTWYADTDSDGFGDPGASQVQCAQPAGHLLDNTDCDDTSGSAAATFPGAAPNDGAACMKDVDSDDWGDDNPPAGVSSGTDCDDTDAVLNPTTIWYADTDSDTYGDPGVSQVQCAQPASHVLDNTDCDDTSGTAAATFPGAAPNDGASCMKDVDSDDWGDDNPSAGVTAGTDCDDSDAVLNPTTSWYADTDLDGFGDPGVSQVQCAQPAGHLLDNTDCDDTSGTAASTFPGAASNDGAGCFKDV